jgi:hypothetical protein
MKTDSATGDPEFSEQRGPTPTIASMEKDGTTRCTMCYGKICTHVVHYGLWEEPQPHCIPQVITADGTTFCMISGNRWSYSVFHEWEYIQPQCASLYWEHIDTHCSLQFMGTDEHTLCLRGNVTRWTHCLHHWLRVQMGAQCAFGFWEHTGPQCILWNMIIVAATVCIWVLNTHGLTLSTTYFEKQMEPSCAP